MAADKADVKFQPAHDHSKESHLQLRRLIHQMELELPDQPICLHMLTTCLITVANDALSSLKGKSEASDESFYFCLCLKLIRRMAEAYPVARYLILAFKQIARRLRTELPSEAKAIVEGLGRTAQPIFTLQSALPVHLDFVDTDLEAASLQALCEESQGLAVGRARERGGFSVSGSEEGR